MPLPPGENEDVLIACIDLVGRVGASGFDFGFEHEDVPSRKAGWWAVAIFQGARIYAAEEPSPTAAFLALAIRLLEGAGCRCGKPVTVNSDQPGCRWRLVGPKWKPACNAEPIKVKGQRGDHTAIETAHRERLRHVDAEKARRRTARISRKKNRRR